MRVWARTLVLAGAMSFACVCAGSDIVMDSGMPPGQDLSGERIAVDRDGARKAEAMELFSEAYLRYFGRSGIGQQGIDLLFKASDLDPDSPELLRDLVSELAKAGSIARSLDRLRDLALRHPDSPNAASLIADVLESEGRRSEAIDVLLSAIKSAKGRGSISDAALPGAVSKLALLQAVAGDLDASDSTIGWALDRPELSGSMQILQAAMAVYSAAARKSDSARPWWALGLLRSDEEAYREKLSTACDDFVRAALGSKEPFNAMLYQTGIGVLKEQGRLSDARKILLNGLLSSLGDKDALSLLARVCYDMKDYVNSCRYWRSALRAGVKPSPLVYSSYALALREAGFLTEAADVYEWQLVIEPGNKVSALQLALTYFELGRVEKCLSRLDGLKGEYSAMYLKAICLDKLKMRQQALDALLSSETLASGAERHIIEERNYRMLRASFAEKARRADIVKESIQPLLDKDSKDSEVLNFLGYTLADLNSDLDLSESCIRKALENEPGNEAYLDSMAWVLYRKGSYKEAKLWIEKALKSSDGPPDGVIADHAGDIYAALGDSEKAIKCWRAALESPSEELDSSRVKAKMEALESFGRNGGSGSK